MLHRQAGEQLARHHGKRAPQIASQLALHFERGRDFARAVEFLTHAGDNATKLYANAEAADHFTRALGLAKKLPRGGSRNPAHDTASGSTYRHDSLTSVTFGRMLKPRNLGSP